MAFPTLQERFELTERVKAEMSETTYISIVQCIEKSINEAVGALSVADTSGEAADALIRIDELSTSLAEFTSNSYDYKASSYR